MKERKILVEKFWPESSSPHSCIYEDELGWNEYNRQDAESDDPETIFRYYVEIVGFNIGFYWLTDRCFYTIETESIPVEVRRLYPNPKWDGAYEYNKVDDGFPGTGSPGELIATFDAPAMIWGNLRISGVPIGKVLEHSLITDLN